MGVAEILSSANVFGYQEDINPKRVHHKRYAVATVVVYATDEI